jgi:hypothetical protein
MRDDIEGINRQTGNDTWLQFDVMSCADIMLFDKLYISKRPHTRFRLGSWNGNGNAIYVFAQNWVKEESEYE